MKILLASFNKILPAKRGVSEEGISVSPNGDEWVRSYCMMCMQADCSTLIRVRNGVAVNIVGNPDSPANQGRLCIRAVSALMGLYNPYRVKTPLKRTNPEKGPDVDPRWVEISWEEALNTVANRLKKIRGEDPRKLVVWQGWGATEDYGRL